MSKIDIKVHALPTEKASNIRNDDGEWVDGKSKICQNTIDYQYYYLYVTTSETPKGGDWFIYDNKLYNELKTTITPNVTIFIRLYPNLDLSEQWREVYIKDCRKVVATDDKELKYNPYRLKEFDTAFFHGGKSEILPIPDMFNLPQISPEFQQAWVREANKGTPIVDAMMEMEYSKRDNIAGLETYDSMSPLIPKLNDKGYVTILPIKKPSVIDEILEYLVENRYNESNPVMYAFIASKHQSILPKQNDIIDIAEKLLKADSDFAAEGMSEYQNGRFNGIIEGYEAALKSKSILPVKEYTFTEAQVKNLLTARTSHIQGHIDSGTDYQNVKDWFDERKESFSK